MKCISWTAILCAVLLASPLLAQGTADAGGDDLFKAVSTGDPTKVRTLLAAKAYVNAKDNDGNTALMAASRDDYVEVVRLLTNAGAK